MHISNGAGKRRSPSLPYAATGMAICVLGALSLAPLAGCGSGGGTTLPVASSSPTAAVSVTPSSPTVAAGATQAFTATVANASNQAVTWSVQEGSSGGTISSAGIYVAPAAAGTYHVIATSVADSTKTATVTVTVQALTSVSVAVSPITATLVTGATQALTATVGGATDQSVTWSVQEGSSGGSVTAAGVYTAPVTAGTYHVIATSAADATKTATATITVQAVSTPATVTISPLAVTLSVGGAQTFTASQSVTWSVQEGASGGTITSGGAYTAPTSAGTYHVIATSTADSTAIATATVTVQSGGSSVTIN